MRESCLCKWKLVDMVERKYGYGFIGPSDYSSRYLGTYYVDFSLLITPFEECYFTKLGKVAKETFDYMNERGFSQAPVLTPNLGMGIRLVSVDRLAYLAENNKPLEESEKNFIDNDIWDVPLEPDAELYHELIYSAPLDVVLSRFMQSPAQIFLRFVPEKDHLSWILDSSFSSDAVQDEQAEGAWEKKIERYEEVRIFGLATIADLNKHVIRKTAYELFLDIESELSQLIQLNYVDPFDWILLLNDDAQAQTLGYWNLSHRRGIDLNPIASLNFTHLLQIAQKSNKIFNKLGYRSKKEFINKTGSMPMIRNRIMHPVRPLVLGMEDLLDFKQTIDSAIELRSRCNEANKLSR